MKKLTMIVSLFLFYGYGVLCAQNLPEVFAFSEFRFKKDANINEALNMWRAFSDLQNKYSRGITGYTFMKGDRGERTGEYSYFWGFEFLASRDYYFPQENGADYPQWAAIDNLIGLSHGTFPNYVDTAFGYTDYVIVGFNKLINPQLGEVFGIHKIKVKPGQEKAFENFIINEYYPAFINKIPGLGFYVAKGDRGNNKNQYVCIYTVDKVTRRDNYWPADGTASDELTRLSQPLTSLGDKLNSFLDPQESDHYTDYIIIE